MAFIAILLLEALLLTVGSYQIYLELQKEDCSLF